MKNIVFFETTNKILWTTFIEKKTKLNLKFKMLVNSSIWENILKILWCLENYNIKYKH